MVRGGAITIENIEFTGARVPDKNGAGIRFEQGQLEVRDCIFENNQNGILTAPPEAPTEAAPAEGEAPYRSQTRFIESARERARQSMMPGPQFRMRPPETQAPLSLEHPAPRMVTRRRRKRAEPG